ncbi:MAG: O-antigen ligase family protein [Rhizobiaceae bacterium]
MSETAANPAEAHNWPGFSRAARWVAIAAIPASLFSPGATVAMALVALYGVIIWARGTRFPARIAWAGRFTVLLYLAIVIIDLINGGGLVNLTSTGINYLHLVAVAPFALALRETGLDHRTFDRAMQVTVLIALAAALVQFFAFNVVRPGGLFLNPIPYGFVLSLWSVFLLSRGLEQGRDGAVSIGVALLAVIPVLLTESKIAWACMILGYAIVAMWWAVAHGRWKTLIATVAAALPLLYLAFHFFAYRRLEQFVAELELFFESGTVTAESFGWRYELATSGLRAFMEKPLFGYGLAEQMAAVFAHTSDNGPDVTFLSHLHNGYVTHLVAFGLAGLLFVVAFMVLLVLLSARCSDIGARRAGIAMTIMLALYMMVEIAFNMDPISGAVTIVMGLLLLRPASGDGHPETRTGVSTSGSG